MNSGSPTETLLRWLHQTLAMLALFGPKDETIVAVSSLSVVEKFLPHVAPSLSNYGGEITLTNTSSSFRVR